MAINSTSHQDATKEALLPGQVEELLSGGISSIHPKPEFSYFYACLAMKNIGKPCAGKPHARFDEGRLRED
jgi:hypothetical protein